MGNAKTEIFTPRQNDIAAYAKALGHPARIAILQHLAKVDPCTCGDLVLEIGLAQATVSQHLKELKQLGIINGTASGTSMRYSIDRPEWAKMKDCLKGFLDQYIRMPNW